MRCNLFLLGVLFLTLLGCALTDGQAANSQEVNSQTANAERSGRALGNQDQSQSRETASLQRDRGLSVNAPDGIIQAVPMSSAPLNVSKNLSRIIFASCAQQNEDQSFWHELTAQSPDLVLYLGDTVYGDVRSNDPALPELKTAYMRLAQSEAFAELRASAPMLTVWDDHDYGLNDAGGNYPFKEDSQKLFNYVWDVPQDDTRRQRPGVYQSWMVGEAGKTVQIIMLDTRYFRSDLKETDEFGARGRERYIPDDTPSKTMLGETQWAWLQEELSKPADLRLLVSTIQVIADGHGWEAWRTLPRERERLYQTIRKSGAENLFILSGDRHSSAIYQRKDVIDYPLFEATSSSVNLPASIWRAQSNDSFIEPGPHRLGTMIYEANYGMVEIDWNSNKVDVSIRGENGVTYLAEKIDLTTLRSKK